MNGCEPILPLGPVRPELCRRANGIIRTTYMALGILVFIYLSCAGGKLHAQVNPAPADTESVLVYPSIAVAVNKTVVIRLPKKATKVSVTESRIADVEVVSPDTLLIHGRAVGATSLVVWTQEPKLDKQQK
jgi:Flp pilus assembly secretin CpaC